MKNKKGESNPKMTPPLLEPRNPLHHNSRHSGNNFLPLKERRKGKKSKEKKGGGSGLRRRVDWVGAFAVKTIKEQNEPNERQQKVGKGSFASLCTRRIHKFFLILLIFLNLLRLRAAVFF